MDATVLDLRRTIKDQSETIYELQRKVEQYERANAVKVKRKIEHTSEFWAEVDELCGKPETANTVKQMIRTKKMTIYDTNTWDMTPLIIAARNGAYDLVQFLINNGSEIDAKDYKNLTALDYVRDYSYPHIENLLLFAKMNVEAGNEVQGIADKIHSQKGVIGCLIEELGDIGKQSKKMWEGTLMELMIRMIAKRKTFCDELLVYCWDIAANQNENVFESELWKAIESACSQILKEGTKRDWSWLKMCLLPSTIWYKEISKNTDESKDDDDDENAEEDEPKFLFFELLKLVNFEAMNQLNDLEAKINEMAETQKDDWLALTKWDIPNEYDEVRQDKVVSGIPSQYTYDQLIQSSGASFNSPNFYDYNQYLSQLVILSQIVDEEFHKSVQEMYGIDKLTKKAMVPMNFSQDDNKMGSPKSKTSGSGIVEYVRGPVKLMERARAKAQTDYAKEPYPASACVIDFNRCALIFDDISTLLRGLKLFVNKVKYYQSGNIIGIARDKNGFFEYVKTPQYADIKLNVVIKGKHNNIIGEVQFLLRAMKEYKDRAHDLYAIQRKEESMKSTVSATLPILLNEEKKIFTVACLGNVKQMCSLMINNNKSINDLMVIDKQSNNNILHRICTLGNLKMMLFLKSMMPRKEFIDRMFSSNFGDTKPIEYAVRRSHSAMTEHLFSMKEVKEKYKDNDPMIFRICFCIFVSNTDPHIINYVLQELGISKKKVIEMLSYRYPKDPNYNSDMQDYHYFAIIPRVVNWGSYAHLVRLVECIGEEAFVANVFNLNGWRDDAMYRAFLMKNMSIVEYILSFEKIREMYKSDNGLMKRIMNDLNKFSTEKKMVQFVIDSLGVTKAKLEELQNDPNIGYVNVRRIMQFVQ